MTSKKSKRSVNGDEHPTIKKPKVDNIMKTNNDVVDLKALRSFKVPKKQKKGENLVVVKVESKEFAEEIQPIIFRGFKCPSSKKEIKFTHAFMVHNDRLQQQYSAKKADLRKVMCSANSSTPSTAATGSSALSGEEVVEGFGFVFIKSQNMIEKIAENGIAAGNIHRSLLCKPDQGVSVCQFSDIYSCNPVKGGWLIIVKYMRGRSYYATEDENPLDAQPNFDSHVSKSSAINPESINADKNFHSTQIFCYEYTEDFDTVNYPRQVLPYAAVQFFYQNFPKIISRNFGSLYPKTNHKLFEKESRTSRTNQNSARESASPPPSKISVTPRPQRSQSKIGRHRFTRENNKDGYYLASSVLKICGLQDWSVNVDIISYRPSYIALDLLLIPELEIYELGRVSDLYDQLNIGLGSVNTRLTISRDSETILTGPLLGTAINYIRIVMSDASRDRTQMARLCSCLKSKAGKIKFPFVGNAFCYVFPDGTFARTLNLPQESYLDVNYLHGLLITPGSLDQHLTYTLSGYMEDEDRLVKVILGNSKPMQEKPTLDEDCNVFESLTPIEKLPKFQLMPSLLKNTAEQQAVLQKTRLVQLVRSDEAPLAYLPVEDSAVSMEESQASSVKFCDESIMGSVTEALDSLSETDLQRVLSMTDLAKPYEPDQHLIGLRSQDQPSETLYSLPGSQENCQSPVDDISPIKPPPPAPAHLVATMSEEADEENSASDEAIRKRLLDIMNSLQEIRPVVKQDDNSITSTSESKRSKCEIPAAEVLSPRQDVNEPVVESGNDDICSVLDLMTKNITQMVEASSVKNDPSCIITTPPSRPPSSLFSNIDIDTRFDVDMRVLYTDPVSKEPNPYTPSPGGPAQASPDNYDRHYSNLSVRARSRSGGGTYHPVPPPHNYERKEEIWNARSRVSVYEPPRNYNNDQRDYNNRSNHHWTSNRQHLPPPAQQSNRPPNYNSQQRHYPTTPYDRESHADNSRPVVDYSEINYSRRRNY